MSCVLDELIKQCPKSCVCVGSSSGKMAQAPYLRHSGCLNQPAPSSTISREAEEDRIPTGAPTHIPGAPNPSLKGTLVSCCCSLRFAHASQGCTVKPGRIQQGQIQPSKIRGVSPRLRSWPGHLTSPHRRSRAKARLWEQELLPWALPRWGYVFFPGTGWVSSRKTCWNGCYAHSKAVLLL